MPRKLIILGAGGHGKVIADIATLCGYTEIDFLDDEASISSCAGWPVIGSSADAIKYSDADFVVAIGNAGTRENMLERLLSNHMHVVCLVHPHATISDDVVLGLGTVVMAGVVVNPGTKIGRGCIINTGATVDHDNEIGDYVHVSVGSHLAGSVSIGKATWIGIGAVVSDNIQICGGCMIGAGTVVVKDINEPGTYIGVPAKRREDMKAYDNTGGGGYNPLIMFLMPLKERWHKVA